MNRKAFMEVELELWLVPNYVCGIQSPMSPPGERPKWALQDVPADMLSNLCDQFRAEIFRKSGQVDPAIPRLRTK